MSSNPLPRSISALWWGVGAVGVVAATGLGGLVLRTPLPTLAALGGDRMQVEVVAPVERLVEPGGILEVGELVDGYSHAAIQPRAEGPDVYDAENQTAWIEPAPPPMPIAASPWSDGGTVVQPTESPPELREGNFGFDAPGPDYAAERRARQDRLDRLQARRTAPGLLAAPEPSPTLDRDSAFY